MINSIGVVTSTREITQISRLRKVCQWAYINSDVGVKEWVGAMFDNSNVVQNKEMMSF